MKLIHSNVSKFLKTLLTPDLVIDSLVSLPIKALKEKEIEYVLLDMDNTFLAPDQKDISPNFRQWIVDAQNQNFQVTGIIDPDEALAGSDELRLILCGGDRCEQRSFRVRGEIDSWAVEPIEESEEEGDKKPLAKLDPPPGARSGWIDRALSQHSFVVLLFYRGFW